MRLLSLLLLCPLPAAQLVAQSTCRPGPEDNESKLLAFFAAPIAFSPAGNVRPLGAGKLRIGGELTYVPKPSAEISRSQRCFGDKAEDTQLSPVFPRPRVAIGLGGGFSLDRKSVV